jgi:hypothetical protein
MTGHVFHPGHDEWHGQTVVVFAGPRTVVGRWHEISGGRLHMHDVAVHEGGEETREAFVARLKQFGIPVQSRDFGMPAAEIQQVTRLRDA